MRHTILALIAFAAPLAAVPLTAAAQAGGGDAASGNDPRSPADEVAALEPAVDTSARRAVDTSAMPAVDTSARPAADTSPRPAADTSPRPATRSVAIDRLDLGTTSITGNQELPKVLYIVPWKRSDLGDLIGRPVNTLLDEVLAPVDPEVFERHLSYYETLHGESQEE